jgi:hypothetical protein
MRSSPLRRTPSLHSLRPRCLLRTYYAPTMLHECSSPCIFCFLAFYLSCVFVTFSYALNDPYQLRSAWLHLAPRWLPKCHGHNGRGRFRDPTPPLSTSDQDVGFGGSTWETPRHQLQAQRLQTSQQRASPEATDEVPEVTPVRSRSSRDLPDGRRQRPDSGVAHPEVTPVRSGGRRRVDSDVAHRDIHPCRKRQAVIHDFDYATSEEDYQVSNKSDEDPSEEVSSSNNGGHDYRQPKR